MLRGLSNSEICLTNPSGLLLKPLYENFLTCKLVLKCNQEPREWDPAQAQKKEVKDSWREVCLQSHLGKPTFQEGTAASCHPKRVATRSWGRSLAQPGSSSCS